MGGCFVVDRNLPVDRLFFNNSLSRISVVGGKRRVRVAVRTVPSATILIASKRMLNLGSLFVAPGCGPDAA